MSDSAKYGATWGGIDPLTKKPYTFDGGYFYDEPIASPPPKMKNPNWHISRAFAQGTDDDLDTFASHVSTQMTANAAIFTSPPVTPASLTTQQGALHTAIAAKVEGGKSLTIDKNAKRDALIASLRILADYIESLPNITPEQAALSGFSVVIVTHHSAATPDAPVILNVSNVGRGQLGIKLQGSKGARGYQFQVTVGNNPPASAGFFSSTRNIVLGNLTPGTTYQVQAQAVGGSNQTSVWSQPVTCMCT